MKKILVAVLLLALSLISFAQYSKDKMMSLITNDQEREWHYSNGSLHSALGLCDNGNSSLFFAKDGNLILQTCVNNKPQRKTLTWTIVKLNEGEWRIDFSESITLAQNFSFQKIRIDLPGVKPKKKNGKMILRMLPEMKSNPIQSVTLISEN